MKKLVLLFILDKYADWEASYLSALINLLGKGQFDVKTVSTAKNSVTSIGGLTVFPNYDIQSCPKGFDGLILVGGLSWRKDDAKKVEPLVRIAVSSKRVLGGICDGAGYLGTLGILNDIKHTSNDLNDLKAWAGHSYSGEINYIREQAVRDGNIITANGTAALEFAKEVMNALKVTDEKTICEWYDFHKLGASKTPMPKI